jgi:hypothetical protein
MRSIKMRYLRRSVVGFCFLVGGAWAGSVGSGPYVPPSVPSANGGPNRRGAFENELKLNNSNVGGLTLKGHYSADARLWAQPLYLHAVTIAGNQYDCLLVATMGNSLYLFDANNLGSPLWSHIGLASTWNTYPGYDGAPDPDFYSEPIGCMGTPVVDQALGFIFVACVNSTPAVVIYKVSLTTGVVSAQTTITGTVSGTGDPTGGDKVTGGVLTFYPNFELPRASLAIANSNVYVSFGSYADNHPWHGWVFSYDEATVTRQALWCATPNGYGGSVWMGGGAPAVDGSGNLYVTTGNGDYNGTTNFANSIVKLSSTLTVLDWWTPSNFATLEANDLDIASVRPMLVDLSQQVVAGGKEYKLYSVNTGCMGHLQGSASGCPAAQVFPINGFSPTEFNGLYSEALSKGMIYFATSNTHTYGFSVSAGLFNTSSVATSATRPFPGDALSVTSNDAQNVLLWAVTADIDTGDSGMHIPVQGTLRVFDGATLTQLFSDAQIGQQNKFNPPMVIGGKVFVASGSAIYVYGL